MPRMTNDERIEQAYIDGSHRAWLSMLDECIRQLHGSEPLTAATLLAERVEAIATLRRVCNEFGIDTDWPDDLNLSDIIDKHLVRNIREP
jgi:hypothetical protein